MARVLIIEDETPMRTALRDALEAKGHRVLTAADGESGLRRAIEEKPDLVLLDIMMPGLDGFEVCAELRRLSHAASILMLTAKGFGRRPGHRVGCGGGRLFVNRLAPGNL